MMGYHTMWTESKMAEYAYLSKYEKCERSVVFGSKKMYVIRSPIEVFLPGLNFKKVLAKPALDSWHRLLVTTTWK